MSTASESFALATGGGETTPAAALAPTGGAPAFLLITGWEETHGKYLPLLRELYARGFTCLTFDLRGLGPTSDQHDTVTRGQNLQDVLAAYDRLAATPGVDPAAVAVAGASYGGYLAALLTRRRAVRWLALRVPALYRDENWGESKEDLGGEGQDAYRRRRLRPEQNEALAACAAFRGDVLVVESGADEVIPPPVLANYRAACTEAASLTFRVIAGADHGLSRPEWGARYAELLLGWATEAYRELRREQAAG